MDIWKRVRTILGTDKEWLIKKIIYNILNKFWKQNHSNILTLYDVFSAICCCGVVDIQ